MRRVVDEWQLKRPDCIVVSYVMPEEKYLLYASRLEPSWTMEISVLVFGNQREVTNNARPQIDPL